jgi:hypothetical protein
MVLDGHDTASLMIPFDHPKNEGLKKRGLGIRHTAVHSVQFFGGKFSRADFNFLIIHVRLHFARRGDPSLVIAKETARGLDKGP